VYQGSPGSALGRSRRDAQGAAEALAIDGVLYAAALILTDRAR
jgi:hypothetical protein